VQSDLTVFTDRIVWTVASFSAITGSETTVLTISALSAARLNDYVSPNHRCDLRYRNRDNLAPAHNKVFEANRLAESICFVVLDAAIGRPPQSFPVMEHNRGPFPSSFRLLTSWHQSVSFSALDVPGGSSRRPGIVNGRGLRRREKPKMF